MKRENFKIGHIPAVLWGKKSDKLFIAIHGNMSHKEDPVIELLADVAVPSGYQVLGFDLPEHGERKDDGISCKVHNCVSELESVLDYAKRRFSEISLFACSIGAYFSLLACSDKNLKQALFLSPIVNMEKIIVNMMEAFGISEDELKQKEVIAILNAPALYWDYYCYVKEHPIEKWNIDTSILYGSNDNLCSLKDLKSFSEKFNCHITIIDGGDHYFHTQEQLNFYLSWLQKKVLRSILS